MASVTFTDGLTWPDPQRDHLSLVSRKVGPFLAVIPGPSGVDIATLPPHKGDTFIPGQLSQALLNAQLTPIVDHIAHAPALPSDDRYDQGGYAEVVVTCTSRDVPSDHLLEQLRNEGWKVHDFRAQAQRRRDGKTF